jgi:hypothetical protein
MSSDAFTPDGFVPLANWDNRHRGNNDGHSVEWKLLSDAAKAGKIPGMKLGGSGRWIVHERSAAEFLRKVQAEPSQSRDAAKKSRRSESCSDPIAALTAALSAVVTSQHTLIHAVERIAFAVERIADQHPLVRMDDIRIPEPPLDCSMNGFHS